MVSFGRAPISGLADRWLDRMESRLLDIKVVLNKKVSATYDYIASPDYTTFEHSIHFTCILYS